MNQAVHPINSIFLDQDICSNVGTGNNTFIFNFSKNITTTGTSRMSVANFSVPYSWFNITAALGNNRMGYRWTDSVSNTGAQTYIDFMFTIPDGFYDITSLNSYLQYQMIQNGHYLIDDNNEYVYFLEFVVNTNSYRDQINSYLLPNSLPSGWHAPPGCQIHFTGNNPYTSSPNAYPWASPKLILVDEAKGITNLFVYFGFIESNQTQPPTFPYQQTFPSTNAVSFSVSQLGDLAPAQSTVHSVCLTCNYIDNPLRSTREHAVSSFVVTTQNINVKFGENIANSNFFTTWIPLLGGQTISSMTFRLTDQEGDPIILEDPDTNIELLLTDLRYS